MSTMPDWSYSNKIAILSHLLVVIFYYSNVCIATTHSPHRGYSNWSGSTRRTISAFGDPKYFTNQYITTDKPDVMILVPNFDVLFEDICKVSPLARQALADDHPVGLNGIERDDDVYDWKVVSSFNSNKLIKEIDKIDGFENKIAPMVRLRSTLEGPKKRRGEMFADIFSTEELRHQWDITNDVVGEIYSGNLEELNQYQDEKYGTSSMFGIGYVKTKKSVVSPREQMTLCGVTNLKSGASIVYAVELEESSNDLLPKNQPKRVPRSTTHLFATTIIPTGEDTFDVEYVLQLEVGGFPGWLTGPVVIDTVKKMFRFADNYFRCGLTGDGVLANKLALIPDEESDSESEDSNNSSEDVLEKKQTLLMTP